MDRRQVLIGSGAVAVASTASWTPEASAQRRIAPLSETIPPDIFPPFEDGLHGTYTFRATTLDLNGSLVPL
jgi:spermidine/putrescine-binding protein